MYKITGVGGQGQSPATMSSLWKQIPTVQKADLFFEHLKVGVLWQKDIEYIICHIIYHFPSNQLVERAFNKRC